VGGIPPFPCKKQRPAPRPARSEQKPAKKFSFPFTCPAEASAQAGKKKSGARKSGNAKKTFLLGGKCQRAAAGCLPAKALASEGLPWSGFVQEFRIK